MKKESTVVSVTPRYQQMFIAAIIGSWFFEAAFEIHELYSHYTSDGTWMIQASMWIYPALLFVLSLGFTLPRYRSWMKRIFFATFLSTAAMAVYTVIELLDGLWYNNVYSPRHPLGQNASTWQTFGNDWMVMAIVLVMYIGALTWVSSRRRA